MLIALDLKGFMSPTETSLEEIMKRETQTIEFKQSWHDEYLKWICGYANAQGGKLVIGVDDSGKAVGVANAKKLMEDIPNKIVSLLGIVADVNLVRVDGRDTIEIEVAPSNVPISYHGVYHYRSGTTHQELTGAALQQFVTLGVVVDGHYLSAPLSIVASNAHACIFGAYAVDIFQMCHHCLLQAESIGLVALQHIHCSVLAEFPAVVAVTRKCTYIVRNNLYFVGRFCCCYIASQHK
jgi:hypothetical protein